MMIVLHTTRYGDTSLIVHGYTREEGRTSLMLRGAFRTSGKRRPSHPGAVLLHPLSIVNYVASRSPKAGMAYLREFSPKYRLHSIREDIGKISIAMFISELLFRTLLHSERDEGLYDFLEDAVLRLEALEGNAANFHLWFLDRYAAYLGFPFERGFNMDYNPFTPQQTGRLQTLHEAVTARSSSRPSSAGWSITPARASSSAPYPSCTRYQNCAEPCCFSVFIAIFAENHPLCWTG